MKNNVVSNTKIKYKTKVTEYLEKGYEFIGQRDNYKYIKIRHTVCNSCFEMSFQRIRKDKFENLCPKCFPQLHSGKLYPGINDIHTLAPEIEKYLYNLSDSYKFTCNSEKEVYFICPNCRDISLRKIRNVNLRGFVCSKCGDKISYGEKYIGKLLDSLNISYEHNKALVWSKGYRYDFIFTYNNIKYIIEVDGGFHYIKEGNYQDLELIKQRDNEKDILALDNGYKVIRLDYHYKGNRDDHIRNSILKSELNVIFHLNNFDFMKIEKKIEPSMVYKVSEVWNNSSNKSLYLIYNTLNITRSKARRYLYRASQLGLVKETIKEINKINNIAGNKLYRSNMKKVKCVQTGEIFENITIPSKKYHANISDYFRKGNKTAGKLSDGTKLTWELIE